MRALSRDNRLVALALFLWGTGEGLFIYILPLYLRRLGADPIGIGVALASGAIAVGVSHIPAGWLADRFGRKRVFITGFALATVAGLLMFAARDLRLFVPALVAYFFCGFFLAPMNAYVAEARGSQSVERAITLVSTGYWSALVFSPALGGLIGQAVGLRALYGLASVTFALASVVLLRLSPQPVLSPPGGQGRYTALFRNRRFLGLLLLMFAALMAMQIGVPFAPNFVVEVRGFDVALVGLLGSVNSLGTTLLNFVVGERFPRRGFLIGQAALAMSLLLLLHTSTLPWLFVAYFLRAGWFLAATMAAAHVGRVVVSSEIGLAMGMMQTALALSLIIGPLAAGPLYQLAPPLPFQVSLGLIAATLPLVWRFAPRRDALSADSPPAVAPAELGEM